MGEEPEKPGGGRREERFAVEGVRGSLIVTADARVTNLGLDGLGIETRTPLEVGRTYALSLSRPDRQLRTAGRVVWCSLVRTERESSEVLPIYRAGVRFVETLTEKAAEVEAFLDDNTVAGTEKRKFGRFRLSRDKAATVGAEAEFVVREMSLSGMLIETDLALRVDTLHRMEIRLPELSFAAQVRIARAEELDEAPEAGGKLLRLGVEFLELDDAALASLEKLRQPE
jgi:Tfp pilus assembly protein PilZ